MTKQLLLDDLAVAATLEAVEQVRIKFLGRKGIITNLAKETDFSKFSQEEKKNFGQQLNDLKIFASEQIEKAIERVKSGNASVLRGSRLIDPAVPGSARVLGSLHPITMIQLELEQIFEGMGFAVLDSPEVETEFNNFEAINIPKDHPARDMQDTFWLKNHLVLRTHTSANQVRTLRRFGVPVRAIFPGRCFRYESIDPSHENTFYQSEGLMVDENVSVANLIGVMKTLLSEIFRRDVKVRLRPGFFPFVEPGFELDLNCMFCGGVGCSTCGDGWI
ncbi:MAG: phenylalanine--tRNA ligase subunit alpha, partial [Planctomycetaceae bacterium]|nr:phenylalanine--tRNA ligase subunit alpha [Planctomycetaceae bacterium]